METVTRNVSDIDPADRQALEHVIGHSLLATQQVIIKVVTTPAQLPSWCNVYEGLTDAEVDEIDASIVRSAGGRTFDS